MHPLRQILSNWEWYSQSHRLRSQSTYEKLRICTGKKLKKPQNNIILYLTTALHWTGRQAGELILLSSAATQLQCPELIFMLHISHLLLLILPEELLAWSVSRLCSWNARRHTAFGGLAGQGSSPRKADCFLQNISPSSYLPPTTWNQELLEVLLDMKQHQWRKQYSPWSQPKVIPDYITKEQCAAWMANPTILPVSGWWRA